MSSSGGGFRPGTKSWKLFMAKLYGIGAAIVIVGAMFKIQHWPGAGAMLVGGLTIEAIIFFFSAFEPIHEEVDWSLVYPELAGMHGEAHAEEEALPEASSNLSITEQLDDMLSKAKIGPDLIESLGSGMRNLSDQASKIANVADASSATSDYVSSVKSAAQNVSSLSQAYSKASESILGITASNEDSASLGEQMNKVSKNLSALNASYELQLQGSTDHLKATSKFYSGLEELMRNLNESVDDTKRYKDEIAQLSSNLTALNTIYGNMLNAMNFKK